MYQIKLLFLYLKVVGNPSRDTEVAVETKTFSRGAKNNNIVPIQVPIHLQQSQDIDLNTNEGNFYLPA